MKTPDIPHNEASRQQALDDLDIVFTPAEERFDRITRLARRVFDVPIALISLVSEDQQWFKSCQGLNTTGTGREVSICGHAILNNETFVVTNALQDPDFSDNPLVTGEPKIRFYAGQPIHVDGQRIGTFCLIDTKPRQLKPRDYDSLKSMASWVELELKEWRGSENAMMQQFQTLLGRASLIDSETGDLNAQGIQALKEKLNQVANEQYQLIEVSIPSIEGSFVNKMELRKDLSHVLHGALDDKGLAAIEGDGKIIALIDAASEQQAQKIIADIQHAIIEFTESNGTDIETNNLP